MYTSLKIVKKLSFAWIYYPNGLSTGFAVSKGYFTADEATGLFQIVEQGKTKRPEVLLENIVVQDESAGGPELVFSSLVDLQQKLSELGNPLMNVVSTNSGQLTNDELEAVQNSNDPSATNPFVTLDDISSILPDVLLESTGYTLVGQDLTFNAFWVGRINNVLYSNPIPVLRNIPLCGAGLFRYDIFVLNTSNTFNRIQGDESSSNIIEPNILPDTVLACTVLVTDSSVGEPIPGITGEEFVKKAESVDFIVDYGATLVIDQINLTDDRSSLSLTNAVTDIKSIQVSGEFLRPGKPHFVKNRTNHNVTIWHLAGTGNVKYFFPNATNLVIKPNEVVEFNLNGNDSSTYRFEVVGTPTDLSNFLVPKIQFTADGVQDTFSIGVTATIKAVFWNGALLNDADWSQTGATFTLTFIPTAGDLIKPI